MDSPVKEQTFLVSMFFCQIYCDLPDYTLIFMCCFFFLIFNDYKSPNIQDSRMNPNSCLKVSATPTEVFPQRECKSLAQAPH